jgi:rod shape-determining protein MreC
LLDLRFVAPNADIQVGDVLVTSGLDGIYPAGLAVAKVIQVENVAQGAFGRVVCQPLAGIDRHRQLLIVMSDQPLPPRPAAEAPKTAGNATSKKNLPRMEPVPPPPLAPQPLAPAVAPAAGAANGARVPARATTGTAAQVPAAGAAAHTPTPAAAAPAAGAPAARAPAATGAVTRQPAAAAPAPAAPAATNAAPRPKEGN